jgi:hypothetical protein
MAASTTATGPLDLLTVTCCARLLAGMPTNGYSRPTSEPGASIVSALEQADPSKRQALFDSFIAGLGLDVVAANKQLGAVDLNAPPPTPRFHTYEADEALAPLPPMQWVIDQLFSRGSLSLLVGAPGSFKTYIALIMAICVALGKSFLNMATTQGGVLLIDEESGESRTKRRIREVMQGMGAGMGVPFAWTSLACLNLREVAEVTELSMLIDLKKPVLVIIDALADVAPGADENSVRDMIPVMLALRSLADKKQVAILVIHHANKMGGYRGSTAISGAVDLMLMVEKKGTDNIEFTTEKCRDIEPRTFSAFIEFDDVNGTVKLQPALTATKTPYYSKSEQYVIDHLTKNKQAAIDDIEANADRCTPEAARRATYALVNKGIVKRANSGARGVKAVYELDPSGAVANACP